MNGTPSAHRKSRPEAEVAAAANMHRPITSRLWDFAACALTSSTAKLQGDPLPRCWCIRSPCSSERSLRSPAVS